MKRFALLTLSLSLGLASATVVERDTKPYQTVIQNITASVGNLDSAVNAYTSSSSDKQPVLDASDALVRDLDAGKATIASLPALTSDETGALTSDLSTLSAKGQTLTDDLKAKRAVVEAASQCDAVRGKLAEISPSAQALVDEALTKVPKSLQPLAQPYVSAFTTSFNSTRDYYSEANCVNGRIEPSASAAGSSTGSSPSGSRGNALLAPVWTLGTVMALFAVYH